MEPPILWGMLKKRPCRVCRKWFRPDARVGDKQKVCSSRECQRARRQKTQAQWRERNPEYFTARRLQERQARREEGKAREPRARRAPLNQLPWDLAQDEFGPQGADFLEEFGRLLLVSWQDAMVA